MNPRARTAGFTLMETLVVVFIMGVLAGAVVLVMPARDGAVREEAARFAAKARLAAEESIMTGRQTGLSVSQRGYAFYRFDKGRWVETIGDRALDARAWGDGVAVSLMREGARVAPAAASGPMVVFDPAGASTAFTVSFDGPEQRLVVAGDESGRVILRDGFMRGVDAR